MIETVRFRTWADSDFAAFHVPWAATSAPPNVTPVLASIQDRSAG